MSDTPAWPRVLYAGLHLFDRQLVDTEGMFAGKVDDLELDTIDAPTTSGSELVVTAISFGHGSLLRRLGRERLGAWFARRRDLPGARSSSLPLDRVVHIGPTIEVLARHEGLATYDTEQWVRDHVTGHIWGSGHAPQ